MTLSWASSCWSLLILFPFTPRPAFPQSSPQSMWDQAQTRTTPHIPHASPTTHKHWIFQFKVSHTLVFLFPLQLIHLSLLHPVFTHSISVWRLSITHLSTWVSLHLADPPYDISQENRLQDGRNECLIRSVVPELAWGWPASSRCVWSSKPRKEMELLGRSTEFSSTCIPSSGYTSHNFSTLKFRNL